MTDLRSTIVPKSDQLNADDLIGGDKTITITKVSLLGESDQPVAIHFEGDGGKPYKPCKSMRRVMVNVWGHDGAKYAGRSMRLFLDQDVKFGGAKVGGIRISHMSNMDKEMTMALTAAKASRKPYTVKPLTVDKPFDESLIAVLMGAIEEGVSELNTFIESLDQSTKTSLWSRLSKDVKDTIKTMLQQPKE